MYYNTKKNLCNYPVNSIQAWVSFISGSFSCSEKSFSGYFGFPSPQKPTPNSKFKFDLDSTGTFKRVLKNSYVLRSWTNYKTTTLIIWTTNSWRPFYQVPLFSLVLRFTGIWSYFKVTWKSHALLPSEPIFASSVVSRIQTSVATVCD